MPDKGDLLSPCCSVADILLSFDGLGEAKVAQVKEANNAAAGTFVSEKKQTSSHRIKAKITAKGYYMYL